MSSLTIWDFFTVPDNCENLGLWKKFGLWISGFKKITCPYGILISASSSYPDNGMIHTANIIANLLDPNG